MVDSTDCVKRCTLPPPPHFRTPILAIQVELSLFLPLRRCLWKELMLRLKGDVR